MDSHLKQSAKTTQVCHDKNGILVNCSQWPDINPTELFGYWRQKDRERSTNKLQSRPVRALQGKKCSSWCCSWVPGFRQLLTTKHFHPHIKSIFFIFVQLLLYPWKWETVQMIIWFSVYTGLHSPYSHLQVMFRQCTRSCSEECKKEIKIWEPHWCSHWKRWVKF